MPSPIQKGHTINLGKVCSSETRKKIGTANSKPKITKECIQCGISFQMWPSKAQTRKLCSRKCQFENFKGRVSWNKGLEGYRAGIGTRPNIMPKGEAHWSWKGNKVLYRSLHTWITNQLGQPKRCEECGKDGLTGRKIHWANKSHNYKRELTDWRRLCASCHKKYDRASLVLQF